MKLDAANAASDLANTTAEVSIGEAAARAQASVGLELALEDAAEAANYASALTFGASNGSNGAVEVSDAGAVTYTANETSLSSLEIGDGFTDTIYYAIRSGAQTLVVNEAEVTVTKTAEGAEVSGLEGIVAKGAKQLSADVSADGLSSNDARALHKEVNDLLGTDSAPGLVRGYVSAAQDALDGAGGSVSLILGTLGITAGSAAAQSNPAAVEALSSLAVAENYFAAASGTLSSLTAFDNKADAFADLADAIEATAPSPILQGLNAGPQTQAGIDLEAIKQAMVNTARDNALKMDEARRNAEADAELEFEKVSAQKVASEAAAATSAIEDQQAAQEVLQALDNTMAAAAKVAGFTAGLKGTVTVLDDGGLVYTADETKYLDLTNTKSVNEVLYTDTGIHISSKGVAVKDAFKGFDVDDYVTIAGSANNNGMYRISYVSEDASTVIVGEVDGSTLGSIPGLLVAGTETGTTTFTETTHDTFFYSTADDQGDLTVHKAFLTATKIDNVLNVTPTAQSQVFGSEDGKISTVSLTDVTPVGVLQQATVSEALVKQHSSAAKAAEVLDSLSDTAFDVDAAKINLTVATAKSAAAALELETIQSALSRAQAAAKEAEIAFGSATTSASGRNTAVQLNASLASGFQSAAFIALSEIERLADSATGQNADASSAAALQGAEIEAHEFAVSSAASAAEAESAAAEAARQVANQTIKDKVDADNAASAQVKELADTAVAQAKVAAEKLKTILLK